MRWPAKTLNEPPPSPTHTLGLEFRWEEAVGKMRTMLWVRQCGTRRRGEKTLWSDMNPSICFDCISSLRLPGERLASRGGFTRKRIFVDSHTESCGDSLTDLERPSHREFYLPHSASRWACWGSTSSPPKSSWRTPTCWPCCSSSPCSCREPSCRPPTTWPSKRASTCAGPFR